MLCRFKCWVCNGAESFIYNAKMTPMAILTSAAAIHHTPGTAKSSAPPPVTYLLRGSVLANSGK